MNIYDRPFQSQIIFIIIISDIPQKRYNFFPCLFQDNVWRKFKAPKGVVVPKGRRSHTATVFQDSMYIYGGYQDLKGSTSELWAFHFGKEYLN